MATSSSPPSRPDSRTATPRPKDHVVLSHHRLSQKELPPDCPSINTHWFYAVDVPKRKPFPKESDKDKRPIPPNKFVPFSLSDSKALEGAFQKLVELEDEIHARRELEEGDLGSKLDSENLFGADTGSVKVPVNEDYLFEVDVRARELAPVYWMGNVYDVRRGTWFIQEGSTLKPCDENLATQVEEGYLRLKPFRRSAPTVDVTEGAGSKADIVKPQQTWRLFGQHMSDFVVFVDANTAWLLSDNLYGKISSTVTQRITFGSHMGGWKLVRGYTEANAKLVDDKTTQISPKLDAGKKESISRPGTPRPGTPLNVDTMPGSARSTVDPKKRRSLPPPKTPIFPPDSPVLSPTEGSGDRIERSRLALERKMSSLEIPDDDDGKLNETDMKEDYSHDGDDDQGRDIDHLILVTHGIGQRLGMRVESVNFVHDVNVMRKTVKSVYNNSSTLQALNSDLDSTTKKNPRIQVLPVCWRHLLDIPDASKGEQEGTSTGYTPMSLQEITPNTVPAVRNLISDLALDVLLYQTAEHRARIEKVVSSECNRILAKFIARQPKGWKGKIHLAGHSLGSAIFWDLVHPTGNGKGLLDFDISSLFLLGSPLPMFLLLRPPPAVPTIAPKHQVFNIYHPCDPLAYRFEPLISRGAAKVKPQDIPYTKASIFSDRGWGGGVQRNVVGWWRGVVSGVLQRGLGFEDGPAPSQQGAADAAEASKKAKKADQATLAGTSSNGPAEPGAQDPAANAGPPLPREVSQELLKWNRTGRVDFAIQEGAFDISLIASIASHLGYWGDEDVAHFIAGQVLAGADSKKEKAERDLGEGLE